MTTAEIKLMPVRVDPLLLLEIAKLQQANNGGLVASHRGGDGTAGRRRD